MKKRISINTKNSLYIIDPEDVLYCRNNGSSTTLCLRNDESLHISKEINDIEKLFEGKDFFRPHQSYLVNRNHIKQVDMVNDFELTLSNQQKIPICSEYRNQLLERIKID